jgi:myo-inositol-1-phosphate synthase
VLDSIVGYRVENHQVHIHYYKPRGDAKEAWDNIDIVGFGGVPMQMKINFLCQDSILAAPLVIDLVRLLDVAKKHGEKGIQRQLSLYFKSPYASPGEHAHPRRVQAGEDPARLGRRARQAAQVTTSGPRRGP